MEKKHPEDSPSTTTSPVAGKKSGKAEIHKYPTGIIGNCSYIAHINTDAEIVWLCWPQFDSSYIFGKLLDEKRGGSFAIHGMEVTRSKQYYLENTNVLVTEVTCRDGRFRVIDFAPRFWQYERSFKPLMVFRKIELLEGNPKVRIHCQPAPPQSRSGESIETISEGAQIGSNHLRYPGYEQQLRLTSNLPLTYIRAGRPFSLTGGGYLVLSYGIPLEAPLGTVFEEFYHKTVSYWRAWVRYSTIPRFFQKEVIRSCLTLKMHQFEDTGAIIASSTTSLPESPGSGRNWDYRYCWIRDAYYTLTALRNIGHGAELERYAQYIQNLVADEKGNYGPVYTITGGQDFTEYIANLEGYLGNKPVRFGNQALEHIQNDVYGQIIVSLVPLYADERFAHDGNFSSTRLIHQLLAQIEKIMHEPDAGLWEFRNVSQKHSYTFLFHWAGAKAALQIGLRMKDMELVQKALRIEKEAVVNIEACYDPVRKVYTQAVGSKNLDASQLQLITMNYLNPGTQTARDHLVALEKELKADDSGLFYRYLHQDDFGLPESTFLICAFWYVEALAAVGRIDEAEENFARLVSHGNHLGLLSEDVDSRNGAQWGNFPQTYSHVGLVNAAFRIAGKKDIPDFLY